MQQLSLKETSILLDRRQTQHLTSVSEALEAPTSADEIVVDDKGNVLTNSQAIAYVNSGGTVLEVSIMTFDMSFQNKF